MIRNDGVPAALRVGGGTCQQKGQKEPQKMPRSGESGRRSTPGGDQLSAAIPGSR
ncbi:hypothetical protein [Pseudarthrobacter sp. NamE5]|uniref:hypothetical protein n=1 Tax=Pseudarthrobacter sp. NamE5 TaxID=2576839 RepID=UPI001487015C|nr:hypothetical protein [Pseudarthrobacter sp. NamE5]